MCSAYMYSNQRTRIRAHSLPLSLPLCISLSLPPSLPPFLPPFLPPSLRNVYGNTSRRSQTLLCMTQTR